MNTQTQSNRTGRVVVMALAILGIIWIAMSALISLGSSEAAVPTTTTAPLTEVSSKVEYVPPTVREKTTAEKYDIWLEDGGKDLLGALMDATVATLDAKTHSQLVRQCTDLAESAFVMGSYQPLPVPEADEHFKASMAYMEKAGEACAASSTFTTAKLAMEPWAELSDSELGKAKALLRAEGLDV